MKHTLKVSPTKFFGTVRQNIFDWKSWYSLLPSPPPLIHNFYSIPDFFWYTDQKGSPTKFFSTETKKKFDTKSWDKSLKHQIFRYPKLVTHWRFPLRNFSALWDENFSTENRDTLLHKIHKSVVELMFVRTFWELISKQ